MKKKNLLRNSFRYLKNTLTGRKFLLMMFALIIMLVVSILTTYTPILLGKIVDSVIVNDLKSFDSIRYYLIIISIFLISAELLVLLRKYIVENIATQVEKSEFIKITKHILSVDLQSLNSERIGALNVKIHRSIEGVIKLLKLTFIEIMPTLMVTIVAIYIITSKNIYISFIAIGIIIISFLITFKQISSQAKVRLELFRAKEDMGAKNSELLLGIDYVKSSGAIPIEVNKIGILAENLRKKEFTHHKYMMSFDSTKMLVEILGLLSVIVVSSYFAINGDISKGDVLTLVMLYSSVTVPLRSLNRFLDEGFEANLMINDLLGIYKKPLDIGLEGKEKPKSDISNLIKIKDVSFFIGKKAIINNLNLNIKKGEKIGIAGASGSGKSTLIKILLGLNSNYNGTAEIFGKDVKKINKIKLAKLISYISQNPFIIKGTIKENVSYPNFDKFSKDEILNAIKLSQIESLVENSELGLNREIEEQGKNISGGEKQRLALTRLFLPNKSQLIIMDEATSALDSINQELIQKEINKQNKEKTIIIIAHRLKTLQNMDKIIVFDKGTIAEEGSYEDLIKKGGIFKKLLDTEKHA